MFKIQLFKETVAKQAWHHPDKPNTFAVATLLYPPQLCWFPDNGFLPNPHYVNRLDEMQWLNTQLMEFNESNGCLRVPHVHKFGVCIDNRSNKDQYGQVSVRHRVFHRWGQWRRRPETTCCISMMRLESVLGGRSTSTSGLFQNDQCR